MSGSSGRVGAREHRLNRLVLVESVEVGEVCVLELILFRGYVVSRFRRLERLREHVKVRWKRVRRAGGHQVFQDFLGRVLQVLEEVLLVHVGFYQTGSERVQLREHVDLRALGLGL